METVEPIKVRVTRGSYANHAEQFPEVPEHTHAHTHLGQEEHTHAHRNPYAGHIHQIGFLGHVHTEEPEGLPTFEVAITLEGPGGVIMETNSWDIVDRARALLLFHQLSEAAAKLAPPPGHGA